jgi:hypothetical protein
MTKSETRAQYHPEPPDLPVPCVEAGCKTPDTLGRYAGWHWPDRRRFLPVASVKPHPFCPLFGDAPPAKPVRRKRRSVPKPAPLAVRFARVSDHVGLLEIILRDLEESHAPEADLAPVAAALEQFRQRRQEMVTLMGGG